VLLLKNKESFIIYVQNENDYDIGSFDVLITYYDEQGNEIDDDFDNPKDLKSGYDYVTALDLPKDDDYNSYIPAKTVVEVVVDKEYQEIVDLEPMYNDKIEMNYKKNGEEIDITLTNKADVDVQVEVAVLFMKNNKPIAITGLDGSFGAGETDTTSVEIPIDWEKSDDEDVLISYDSIKLVVNRAIAD